MGETDGGDKLKRLRRAYEELQARLARRVECPGCRHDCGL